MSVNLKRVIRGLKPEKQIRQLTPRSDAELKPVSSLAPSTTKKIILDTCSLVDLAGGNLPASVTDLFSRCIVYQSSICIAEIFVGVSKRDVTHMRWPDEVTYWNDLFRKFPPERIVNPDADVWARAAIAAGAIARTQGYQDKHDLLDAAIYLSSQKEGITVVTRNKSDFDFISQICGGLSFAFY